MAECILYGLFFATYNLDVACLSFSENVDQETKFLVPMLGNQAQVLYLTIYHT